MNGKCLRAILAFVAASVATTGVAVEAGELTEAELAAAPAVGYTTVVIREKRAVTRDLTVPHNVVLRFENSGALQVEEGRTLRISGSLDAPMQQIFQGPGKIVFGPGRIKQVHPQWWGARGDGEADDTSAIQSAIDSLPGGGVLFFAAGVYGNTGVTPRSNVTFKGTGAAASALLFTPKQGACITLPTDCSSFRLQDMGLRGRAPNEAYGVDGRNEYVRYYSMANFHVTGFKTGVCIAQGMHISLDYGYMGCYGQGEANGTVCLKLGDKPTNKGCTTATIKDIYFTNAETGFYSRAAPCLLIRPIFETSQIGFDNYTRAVVIAPFMEANKKADARMTDNGVLFIGISAAHYTFLYANETLRRRTSWIPDTFDCPMKLGPMHMQTNGDVTVEVRGEQQRLTGSK